MPKRFPHGLVKSPSKMNKSEWAVLVGLAASVSVGLYEMGSSLYKVYGRNDRSSSSSNNNNTGSVACPINWGNQSDKTR